MSETRIASRYAQSLYDAVSAQKNLDAVVADVRNLNTIVTESREFNQFLQSPLIAKDTKTQIFSKLFSTYQKDTLNLFLLMTRKNRESFIGNMGLQFMALYNKSHGITEATVTTANELTDDSIAKIEQFIKHSTGAKSVNIHTKIDPTLIGGITIMFEGKIYDSSISSQIKKIKKELKIA